MVQSQTSTTRVDNVSYEVIKKVAEVKNVDPLGLTPPLYEVIDPDALEIFASTPTAGGREFQVTFPYNECKVTVYGDGHVSVQ